MLESKTINFTVKINLMACRWTEQNTGDHHQQFFQYLAAVQRQNLNNPKFMFNNLSFVWYWCILMNINALTAYPDSDGMNRYFSYIYHIVNRLKASGLVLIITDIIIYSRTIVRPFFIRSICYARIIRSILIWFVIEDSFSTLSFFR